MRFRLFFLILDLIKLTFSNKKKQKKMKLKKQENGTNDETKSGSTGGVQITNEDREKGDFDNFNLSKKTIKKLQGKI